jgi:signal transduction histidine kinase
MNHQTLKSLESISDEELERILAVRPATAELFATTPDSYFLDLLASIDRSLLDKLMSEHKYARGEIIFKEGDRGDSMYLIRSGRVVVVKGDLDLEASATTPTILGYRGPGEIIGEMALLEGRPRSASIIAVERLRMLKISRESFQELLNSEPALGMSIMASLSARLRAADTVRDADTQVGKHLVKQVSELRTEKQQLLEIQRLREETSNFIIHDLRNPLGIVNGVIHMLEMVLPEEILEDNQKLLDAAKSASGRMQLLVDSLLDVARLEAGRDEFNLTPMNIQTVIEKAIGRVAPTLELSDITVAVQVDDDMPAFIADEEKIDRVLTNLIDNAIKYTPDGGKITVTAVREDDHVKIGVNDTGPGIPSEERERIFQRFAQVKGDRPRRRGFGLGLTFCQLAVEGHGGRIWVEEGENGIGSRFMFTLPLSQ